MKFALLCFAAAQVVALAADADIPASVQAASVVWADAKFSKELGSMPAGNGDIAANVWVDEDSGDLLFYLAKSDAFDQNAQPIKVGRFRLSFDPPLWKSSDISSHTTVDGYTGPIADTIGGQGPGEQIAAPDGNVEWTCSSQASCPQEASSKCNSTPNCRSFSCRKTDNVANFQLHTTGNKDTIGHKGDWNFFFRSGPTPPPAPTPAPTPSPFMQTLNLGGGAVDITTTAGYSVKVFVDANEPVMRVVAEHASGPFKLTSALEIYRTKKQKTSLGRGFCNGYNDIPDVLVNSSSNADSVTWYHRNDYALANDGNPSFYAWSMNSSGVDPSVTPDRFENLTFGGTMKAADGSLKKDSSNPAALSGSGLSKADVTITLFTAQTKTADDWLQGLQTAAAKTTTSSMDALAPHEAWWASFWGRSSINMGKRASDSAQMLVENQYVWARYLDACDGRNAGAAIKFNGQAFTVDMGKGPDARDWGACYWFQNTRQPYYNALAAGDLDIMRPLYAMYNRSIPAIKARVAAQFGKLTPKVTGGVWPETMTQFGMYNEGDWGCSTPPAGKTGKGDSANTYIRFHFTGSLELALFTLDDYTMTGNTTILEQYGLPICETVLEFFRTRFPNKDSDGKTDMFPSQALETHQCPDPTSRKSCATNPSTDLSGLKAILTRLIALPTTLAFVTPAMRTQWQQQLSDLPDLPMDTKGNKILPVAPGYTQGDHNSENTALYPVHPFRLYGTGKPNLDTAQNTYAARKHKCNSGWCQDVIDAAMLNLTADAQQQVAQRAASTSMFRFRGFAGHMQDYEPSLDHFAFMRTAMHYMLLSPLDDAKQGILLFPTWPVDEWDVDFKLHGPLSTTIEAACVNGTLTKLVVTPKEREADVTVLNCRRA